jgi:KaiC/GvpD/RAD55 family RecA-like ATPase
MLRFGIDLDSYAESDQLVFADIPALDLEEVSQLIDGMGGNVKRLVIDPISALEFNFANDIELRQKIRELVELIREKGVTALITTEIIENSDRISRFGIEDFLADGIVVMYYFREGARRYRGIEIRKMRGTAHSDMVHLYKIDPEVGVRVYPNEKALPD